MESFSASICIFSHALAQSIDKKICNKTVNCNIKKIKSNTLEDEIKLAILKKASILEKEHFAKVRKSFNNKYKDRLILDVLSFLLHFIEASSIKYK